MDADNPGLIMPPPFFTAIAIILAVGLEWLVPQNWLGAPGLYNWQTWLGLVLIIGGGALIFPAINAFRAKGTNVHPGQPTTGLVTDGLYQFSRNPMYVGCLLFYLGVDLIFALEWGVIGLPLLFLAFDRMIVVKEEAYLSRKFGTEYDAFKGRTRRWL